VATRKELYDQLWRHRAGERVNLQIYRNNEVMSLDVSSENVEEFFA